MHQSILIVALVGQSLAAPTLLRRSTTDIMSALATVKSATDNLDTAIQGIGATADPTALAELASMSTTLSNVIVSPQQKVEQTSPVDLTGALQISQSANGLVTSVQSVSKDIVGKMPVIASAGLSSTVSQMLQMQKMMSMGLSSAVAEKVPTLAKPQAQLTASMISKALDEAISAYGGATAATTHNSRDSYSFSGPASDGSQCSTSCSIS
jgi:hypothetical protein